MLNPRLLAGYWPSDNTNRKIKQAVIGLVDSIRTKNSRLVIDDLAADRTSRPQTANTTTDAKTNTELLRQLSETLKHHLVVSYANSTLLPVSFKTEIHSLYLRLLRSPSKVFDFLDDGFLLLLSTQPIRYIPHSAVNDVIGVFEVLILELTRHYDDRNEPANDDFKSATKALFFFMISCSRYSTLLGEHLDSLLHFVIKLARYNYTMPAMTEYWLESGSKEPDSLFIFKKYKLNRSYYPVYELAKEFLFMGDRFTLQSREILSHVVLIAGVSECLKNWLLSSDFPSMVISGLLTTFNQACNNERLLEDVDDDENLQGFSDYLFYIMNLISCASASSTVQFVLLNSLEKGFINKIIDLCKLNKRASSNIIFLLCHTFITLLSSANPQTYTLITDDLLEKYFNPKRGECNIQNVMIQEHLLDPRASSTSKASIFTMLRSFVGSNSRKLTFVLFSDQQVEPQEPDPLLICDLGVKLRHVIEVDSEVKKEVLNRLDAMLVSAVKHEKQSLENIKKGPTGQLDFKKTTTTLLLFKFLNFFENGHLLNESVLDLLVELAHYYIDQQVQVTLFGSESILKEVLDFNWALNRLLVQQLDKKPGCPPELTGSLLESYSKLASTVLGSLNTEKKQEFLVNENAITENSKHLHQFILKLYTIYEAKLLLKPTKLKLYST